MIGGYTTLNTKINETIFFNRRCFSQEVKEEEKVLFKLMIW